MEARWRAVVATVLVLAGAGLWFVVRRYLPSSEREWTAQIATDALPLTQALAYERPLADTADFDRAWEKRRALYDAAHLARMRDRLTAFVEFQVAEYADAKEIYLAGRDPAKPSTNALLAQQRLRDEFGDQAKWMIEQYATSVREAAYKASPKVAGGADPDLPRYDERYDDVVTVWLPKARAAVERLTSPAR